MNNQQQHKAVVMRRVNAARDNEGPAACETACKVTGPQEPEPAPAGEAAAQLALPHHLGQFLKMAEHRKRQILEKMLLDG